MSSSAWHPIAHTSNQVVLYHPPSNALTVRSRTTLQAHASLSSPGAASPDRPSTPHSDGVNAIVISSSNGQVVIDPPGRPEPGNTSGYSELPICPFCLRYMPQGPPHPPPQNSRSSGTRNTEAARGRTRSAGYSLPGPSATARFAAFRETGDDGDSRASTPSVQGHAEVSSVHDSEFGDEDPFESLDMDQPSEAAGDPGVLTVNKPYFRILQQAHEDGQEEAGTGYLEAVNDGYESVSPTGTIRAGVGGSKRGKRKDRTPEANPRSVEGYYTRFFVEEKKLGMGAEGSVYLCQHVLDNIPLGHYAIKKVAIGSSRDYLHKMLREVRLLESLRHPNIVGYHHVWIEDCRFSALGEPIAALHVLMMYANAGNLDTYISLRRSSSHSHDFAQAHHRVSSYSDPPTPISRDDNDEDQAPPTAAELKARFRAKRAGSKAGKRPEAESRGVILLSREEIASLAGDIVSGLAFLHSNSILHLDLKCSNVLLHRRDDMSMPTAMISDFGTSQEMVQRKRERTGHTGTMEYMAPESIYPDHLGRFKEMDSKVDIWSLGLILHKLLFFRLPYERTDSFDALAMQITSYNGFKASHGDRALCSARSLPPALLTLLESMIQVKSSKRPTAAKVEQQLEAMDLRGSPREMHQAHASEELQLLPVRRVSPGTNVGPLDGFGRLDTRMKPLALPSPTRRQNNEGSWLLRLRRGGAGSVTQQQLKGLLAILKVISLFPPMRSHNPGTGTLGVAAMLAAVDLFRVDVAASVVLLGCHLLLLAL